MIALISSYTWLSAHVLRIKVTILSEEIRENIRIIELAFYRKWMECTFLENSERFVLEKVLRQYDICP